MEKSENQSTPPMFVHSCYSNAEDSDAVIVKQVHRDDSGNVIPSLAIIENPKKNYWVTKPKFRNHEFKKTFEHLDRLDRFTVPNKYFKHHVYQTLNDRPLSGYMSLKEVCNNPYIYGADISIEVQVKQAYIKQFGGNVPIEPTVGFLDIETDVINGTGEIILITVTHGPKVYTAIHKGYLYHNRDPKSTETPRPANVQDVKLHCQSIFEKYEITDKEGNQKITNLIKDRGLEFEYFVGTSEAQLIIWIFSKIHQNKTDFVGIWNMNFDMPKMTAALERAGIDPVSVYSHPEVPAKYRHFKYFDNSKKKGHFTDKWHWCSTTGYTQITDSQNLYARLRKVKGYLESYRLAAILNKELNLGKLFMSSEDSHYKMQKFRFMDYIAYNQFDDISLYLMELQNTDHQTMSILAGTSIFSQFAYQTVMLTNAVYKYAINNNMVPASAGSKEYMKTKFTKVIKNMGGTVLEPERCRGTGDTALSERPYYETMLSPCTFDLDFSSYYPFTQSACNIGSDTKVSTSLSIEFLDGRRVPITDFFSSAINLSENAVAMGQRYFNLPGYGDIETRILAELRRRKPELVI